MGKAANKLLGKEAKIPLELTEEEFAKLKPIIVAKMNEIPELKNEYFTLSPKRLHNLVECNEGLFRISDAVKEDFPLLPTDQKAYCDLLPSIVRSLGITTNSLNPEQIAKFNHSASSLAHNLAKISDKEFSELHITQEYSKNDFMKTVLEKVKGLSSVERQKVYDYYGFELRRSRKTDTGFTIIGYPVNLNNGHKLAQITDPQTKSVVESLRPEVIKFSENNPIHCENKAVEKMLNDVAEALPEIRTMIGKKQHGNGQDFGHDFDVMQHSLKVMQKITQDKNFESLSESDKKLMLIASLTHDITKAEGYSDHTHTSESSFDAFYIAKKFNLTRDEEIKLYNINKSHEWLAFVNSAKSEEQRIKRMQSVAFDLQHGNQFDLAQMFTHADLKAVTKDNSFHDTTVGSTRVDFDGKVRSFGQAADEFAPQIKEYIKQLQKTQPLLPCTKRPQAARINQAITKVNPDGSTNLKGVYKDKDGLVIIKFNEVTDEGWQAMGLPKGSTSKGTKVKYRLQNNGPEYEVETGNIKFFVHALDYENQLAKFDAFTLPNSDALLSVSYAERVETKNRFFRPQGILLDVETRYVHGGGNTDSGSGYCKSIQDFKDKYIFGGERESDRNYVSDIIKEATGMDDDQYIQFVERNKDKSMVEILPDDYRTALIQKFGTINSNTRRGGREYNEIYASNVQAQAPFAYNTENSQIGDPIEFLKNADERTAFLRKYALSHDFQFFLFGD